MIVFKDWFPKFVLAASARLDHDWCYLVTLACSWFASDKLRIVLTFFVHQKRFDHPDLISNWHTSDPHMNHRAGPYQLVAAKFGATNLA